MKTVFFSACDNIAGDVGTIVLPEGMQDVNFSFCEGLTGDVTKLMLPEGTKSVDFEGCKNINGKAWVEGRGRISEVGSLFLNIIALIRSISLFLTFSVPPPSFSYRLRRPCTDAASRGYDAPVLRQDRRYRYEFKTKFRRRDFQLPEHLLTEICFARPSIKSSTLLTLALTSSFFLLASIFQGDLTQLQLPASMKVLKFKWCTGLTGI